MERESQLDLAIVGGGLAGGLLAYALSVRRPELKVRLIEGQAVLGGNHVWSFFSGDIDPADRWIIEPFVDHSWDGYQVRFPTHSRDIAMQYNSVRSHSFDTRLRASLPSDVIVEATAVDMSTTTVTLDTQERVCAGAVIDARGAGPTKVLQVGWQKFMGREVRTAVPHGLDAPIVMDASVPQIDGYRFVYVLPFGPDRLFIEDTYYSDGREIDGSALGQRIDVYARGQGWTIAEVLSEETGALPVTLGGDFEAYWRAGGETLKIGMRAGLFHPATGYSLPEAVRIAAMLIAMDDLTSEKIEAVLHDYAARRWREMGFYRLLNRMVFRAARDDERVRIYQRFYRLRPRLIERFYAGHSTLLDKARILAGRPPVPISRALKVLQES